MDFPNLDLQGRQRLRVLRAMLGAVANGAVVPGQVSYVEASRLSGTSVWH